MLNAQAEFERREEEIHDYLNYIEELENQVGLSVPLMNTMKSSAILMLYNIIEATMVNLMKDLFDHFDREDVSFDVLNDTMKTLVLTYSKNHSPSKLVRKMKENNKNLVFCCFNSDNIFSGNLDGKKIKETLRDVGVKNVQIDEKSTNADLLLAIKKERNDLAHGVISFSECGKSYSARRLREFYDATNKTMKLVIKYFEEILNNRTYL